VSAQFVDWGTLLTLLGLLGSVVGLAVGLLWRAMATQMKMLHERFDKQDNDIEDAKNGNQPVWNGHWHVPP